MSLVPHARLDVHQVLCHLSARGSTPSNLGTQLDNLSRRAKTEKPDPLRWGAKAKKEAALVKDLEAAVLRDAAAYRLIHELGQVSRVDADAQTLFAVSAASGDSIGVVVVRTLRAYQEALSAPDDADIERATARASRSAPDRRALTYQHAIEAYQAPRALAAVMALYAPKDAPRAASLYADCYLILSLFVARHNRNTRPASVIPLAA